MLEHLIACQESFGPPPRKFGLRDRLGYMKANRPGWVRKGEPMLELFQNASRVYREGEVVWGHVVQANSLLFQKGADDCPGDIVFSLEDPNLVGTDHLAYIAHHLYGLKETKPADPGSLVIANHLTDEYTRLFGQPIPKAISPDLRCHMSSTFFMRKHLPGWRMFSSLFPLVVDPNAPHFALPLPGRFWPEGFRRGWTRGEF